MNLKAYDDRLSALEKRTKRTDDHGWNLEIMSDDDLRRLRALVARQDEVGGLKGLTDAELDELAELAEANLAAQREMRAETRSE